VITTIGEDEVKQGSEEWKQLRSQYLTGTDAIKLLRGYTPKEILKKKQKEINSFSGNVIFLLMIFILYLFLYYIQLF